MRAGGAADDAERTDVADAALFTAATPVTGKRSVGLPRDGVTGPAVTIVAAATADAEIAGRDILDARGGGAAVGGR